MHALALPLLLVGALLTVAALIPWSWDFAVAVAPRWHVTIFPPPLWLGVVLSAVGIASLVGRIQSR